MNLKPYPSEKWTQIEKSIEAALKSGATPVAAFDADGTLWDTDMGEAFFQYQIQHKLLPNAPPEPWKHYKQMHDQDEPLAFLWLAQVNAGLPIEQVRGWAKDALKEMDRKEKGVPIFPGTREIIQLLQKRGVEIYVVTASIKWAVEPGAELLGIPADNVIGVQTAVEKGIVTEKQKGPITWREGKVKGLLEFNGGRKPFLSAGNTMGDLALLEAASHVRLVHTAATTDRHDRNLESEQNLLAVARKRGWFFHEYR